MSLLKSTAVVSGMTMVSRVLGFVRDIVIANVFGAKAATDAFFVAFKIPNFLRRLFAEGAFSQAFVPVLSEYKAQRELADVQRLVAFTTGTLGALLLLITLLGVVGAPLLAALFGPGFIGDDGKYALTVELLRVTFPYLFFISLTALASGILNSYGRFAVPALTPVWLNIVMIVGALWGAPRMAEPVAALAWAVFVAGIVQLAFQLPTLWRLRLLVRPRWGWRSEGVQRIIRLMLPAIFGSSVAQINLLLDTIIASFLVSGSVTWLYFSDRLVEFPLGVFAIALATVILPSLSDKHARDDSQAFAATLDWALRWVLLIGVPAALGLMFLAGPIITTLYQYGEFTPESARMTALSLMAYSVGLLGFMLVKVLAPGFFSRHDTRTPVRIGIYAMLANMALNLIVVVPLAMQDIQGLHAGLALATSLAAFVNASLLFRRLRQDGVLVFQPGWGGFILRVVMANAAMVLILWFGSGTWADWTGMALTERLGSLVALIGGGAAVYVLLLLLAGIRPAQLLGRH